MGPLRVLVSFLLLFGLSMNLAIAQDPQEAARSEDSATAADGQRSIPRVIRFSGAVRERTGAVGLTFAIYAEPQGGAPLWLETQNVQLDEQGRYSVLLGRTSPHGLPLKLFATGEARWLGVRVAEEGAAEQPRMALVSVPYALTAANAQTLGGRPASDFQLTRSAAAADAGDSLAPGLETSGTVSSTANTVNRVAKFTGVDTVGDSLLFDNGTNVGVGTTTPAAKLDVAGKIRISTNVASGGSFLELTGTSGSMPYIGVNTDNQFDIRGAVGGTRFINNAGSAINIIMTDDGRIGVGLGNPTEKLEVAGNANFFGNVTLFGGNAGLYLNAVSGNRPYVVGNNDNQLDLRGGTAGTRFINNAGSAINIIMTDDGKIGVGLGTPTEKLEVAGNTKVFGDVLLTGNGAGVQFTSPSGNRPYIAGTGVSQLDIRGAVAGTRFLNNAATLVNVMLTDAGNVGIGLNAPSEKLQVAGTIHSTVGGFKFPDGTVQLTAAGGGVSGSCPNGQFIRAIAGGGVTCATDQTVGLNLPVSASGSTSSGGFTITQTNSVVLANDPTFASAQTTIPAGVVGIATATTNTAAGVAGFSSSPNSPAIVGWNGSATGVEDDDASGVLGLSDYPTGRAIMGEANHTSGANTGVAGWTRSTAGTGVYGRAESMTGSTVGVLGETQSPSGSAVKGSAGNNGVGGRFESFGGIPLIATANGSDALTVGATGTTTVRTLVINSSGGNPFTVTSGPNTLASMAPGGTFSATSYAQLGGQQNEFNSTRVTGTLQVTGSLSKGSGSFKIDHPLDPANKYLYHSFVESPDMMNIYNGMVKLDARGEAWVTMPEWFEALNMDFRYQLTAVGRPAPNLYVAREIKGNRFKIAGGKPNAKVSWQVTGVRQDVFAKENRIQVEVAKPPQEQGTYLYPQGFQPKPVVAQK